MFKVLNTYSREDIAYKQYGADYKNTDGYDIKVVKSLEKTVIPIPGDHSFLGETYKQALIKNINDIRVSPGPGIYDAKS